MTFHPSADRGLIQAILTHPKCWRPAREEFPLEEGNYRAILCREDDGLLAGLFLLCPTGAPAASEVHLCLLPHAVDEASQAVRLFVEWAWRETSLRELRGLGPSVIVRDERKAG